jgi:hypothetical protein
MREAILTHTNCKSKEKYLRRLGAAPMDGGQLYASNFSFVDKKRWDGGGLGVEVSGLIGPQSGPRDFLNWVITNRIRWRSDVSIDQ